MKVRLHPAAERDVEQAAAFYEREASRVLAVRFITEFWHVVTLLRDHPAIGVPGSGGRRSFGMRVFPYAAVYEVTAEGIQVLVVRHHRRHPGMGSGRR